LTTKTKRYKRRKRKRREKMTEPAPEAVTPETPEEPVIPPAYTLDRVDPPTIQPMSMAQVRGFIMPLANASMAVRDGMEALLEHPHAQETLGDLAEPLKTISDKLWRLMLAALARSS
jgi:hypothetical protein